MNITKNLKIFGKNPKIHFSIQYSKTTHFNIFTKNILDIDLELNYWQIIQKCSFFLKTNEFRGLIKLVTNLT